MKFLYKCLIFTLVKHFTISIVPHFLVLEELHVLSHIYAMPN